jgi:hypothetical protein
MSGTPNTIGVMLLFVVVFPGLYPLGHGRPYRHRRPRRGRRGHAGQRFLIRYAAPFFGRNARRTSDSPKQITRHRISSNGSYRNASTARQRG